LAENGFLNAKIHFDFNRFFDFFQFDGFSIFELNIFVLKFIKLKKINFFKLINGQRKASTVSKKSRNWGVNSTFIMM